MMLEDIKVSDFPKNPMPVPEHVKNWKLVWEKVPPSQEKLVVRGYLLIICSTVIMVVGSLLQILFFYLYNGPFHPFANILVDETEGKDSNLKQLLQL